MPGSEATTPEATPLARRLSLVATWLVLSILSAVVYGILNDQITVALSPEYFSVFKQEQFGPFLAAAGLENAPTRLQAVVVGTIATWWFGLLLGVLLSFAGAFGAGPPISTRAYFRVVIGIMCFALGLSAVLGAIAYAVEPLVGPTPAAWPFLANIHDLRSAFAVGFWHDGAYLGGVLGAVIGVVYVRRLRTKS